MNKKIDYIRKSMGLNILELRKIFKISDLKGPRSAKTNKRINIVLAISRIWAKKNIGRIGGSLHSVTDDKSRSLFDFMCAHKLDIAEIISYMSDIADLISERKQRAKSHEEWLEKNGFEPISKEAQKDNLFYNTISIY